jgi:hypothetical protein
VVSITLRLLYSSSQGGLNGEIPEFVKTRTRKERRREGQKEKGGREDCMV